MLVTISARFCINLAIAPAPTADTRDGKTPANVPVGAIGWLAEFAFEAFG
jgi:hypothetical protein